MKDDYVTEARVLQVLGRVLRDRRGALNMDQPDLAERAEVSSAFVYMLETGGLPALDGCALRRIAEALCMTRLVELLDDALAVGAVNSLSPSVLSLAIAEAVARYIRELPGEML